MYVPCCTRGLLQEKLKKHVEKGEPELGFFGHPMCKFCVKRFYDTMHLYEHLTREHMECDLCAKEVRSREPVSVVAPIAPIETGSVGGL